MSDETSSEKTEQPTPKKLRDARESGQVAQSKEITIFIAISTIIVILFVMHKSIVRLLASNYLAMMYLISNGGGERSLFADMTEVWRVISASIGWLLVVVGIAAILSLGINVLQIGGIVFSNEFIKFDSLNPVNNFKQVFSMKNLVKFLKNLVEITIITSLAYYLLLGMLADLIKLSQLSFVAIITLICADLLKILVWLLGCYLVFALSDWWWEKYNLIKQLKMTKDEVEKENKDTEGDPEIKGKRKELHRELLSDDGVSDTVKDSTLVLANPTHIAIVLLYSPRRWALPLVLIKATDDHAQKIFGLAKKYNIPIIREKYLTRQLYELAEVGKFIPKSLILDVGEVIKRSLKLLPNVVKELTIVQAQKSAKVSKV